MLTKTEMPARQPIDIETEVNDLARLARALHTVSDVFFGELRSYAGHMQQVADALMMLEPDMEVLTAMIEEADIQARDLRVAYYG
jgi:hypothetical protein